MKSSKQRNEGRNTSKPNLMKELIAQAKKGII